MLHTCVIVRRLAAPGELVLRMLRGWAGWLQFSKELLGEPT